eukprot:CAMPEP_0206197540 /NCGR_PEP_ID=MMETSP0166-20121206/9111_1 /ASSEMBLY_ACC=CAM_ASM_000260 /TAXON_ID=95228 /ORGANISM="Vannella robusta, Strain DIVA3 518/3/11/1/6" /LENGTH=238 /DNA_ID=CAMNT_0053615239 /DNA_START=229 /DNA_END=942 /DNA_ORIENTATION=+
MVWTTFAELAAEQGYVVLIYDLYGRGSSEAPYAPQTPSLFSSQLAELFFKLQHAEEIPSGLPTSLIGLSMGGAIAVKFSNSFHVLVDQLILIAPAGLGAPIPWFTPLMDIPYVGDWLMKILAPYAIQQRISSLYGNYGEDNWEGKLAIAEWSKSLSSALANQFEKHPGFADSLLATIRDFPLTDMEYEYKALAKAAPDLPIHFIWGENDTTCPPPTKQHLQQLVPGSHVHMITGAEHD